MLRIIYNTIKNRSRNKNFCCGFNSGLRLISIISVIVFMTVSISCKKSDFDPTDSQVKNDKTNLSVVWYKMFYSDSTGAYFHDPYFSNDYVAFCSESLLDESNQIGIGIYNKSTGEKHPSWNFEPGTIEDMSSISDWSICGQNNNLAVLCNSLKIKCLDVNTGTEKWTHSINNLNFRFGTFGNYIYTNTESPTKAVLIRINSETGEMNNIFTRYTTNGYEPSFESYSGWIAPWGDSVLIFQNRQYNFTVGDGKVDIYAYNLEADSVLWVIDDISTDGNSSIQKPNIADNKLYFQGMKSQHCINLLNGEIIWEHEYQNEGFAEVENLYADGKLFARSGHNILAYDANTGNLLWKIDYTYGLQTGGRMGFYQGKLYFTGIDKTDTMFYPTMVFCLNASDGSLVWKGNRVADGATVYNMADGVIIDQATGYLYVNDALRIICIDLNKTPLDTSSK